MIKSYPLIRGFLSYMLPDKILKRPGSGGTFSSLYCYSVWLRHLHYLVNNGLIRNIKDLKSVAEIGPGDSLGIGISALYTGASIYNCFDVIKHASVDSNLTITKELKLLFQNKAEVPHAKGFENVNPALNEYSFPSYLNSYSEEYYELRCSEIERALKQSASELSVNYVVPWTSGEHSNVRDIDLIFSQAVMEHVSDINFAYREMYKWLRPGGIMSHQIDFKTHEMTTEWNGHWFISDGVWKILSHGRKYPMNRLPLSAHLKVMKEVGFEIKFVLPVTIQNQFAGKPKMMVPFTDDDLRTAGALIQASKPE